MFLCTPLDPATPRQKNSEQNTKRGVGFMGEEYFAYSFSMRKVDLHIKQYNKKSKVVPEEGVEVGNEV
jgi:hypothetical protein